MESGDGNATTLAGDNGDKKLFSSDSVSSGTCSDDISETAEEELMPRDNDQFANSSINPGKQ